MKIFKEVLRKNRAALVLFAAATALNATVFLLYDILTEPLLYAAVLSILLLATLLAVDFVREKRRADERFRALAAVASEWRALPEAHSLAEEDCQKMIAAMGAELDRLTAEANAQRQDMVDYYTAWVHQIKTPIAVMKLKLSGDTPEHRALSAELRRIEQYAEMALQYIRIGSETNDLVIREYPLDELIREAVRKQAAAFVEKRLRLDYAPTGAMVVTDRKWFACILDQLLSNAVKYTPEGTVGIAFDDGLLTVSDTGVGIAPEDLPRIFEMGYTGCNGRLGQASSGLGLYLAKRAADLLSIPLAVESTVGQGSAFTLDLRQNHQTQGTQDTQLGTESHTLL